MANGELMNGAKYEERDDVVQTFTQQMMEQANADLLVGQARTEVTPVDAHSSLVRVFGVPSAAFDAIFIQYVGTTSLNLPDELLSVTVTYNTSALNGENIHDAGAGVSIGSSGGLRISPSSTAQGSASVIPDVQPQIRQIWSQNIPTRRFLFYLPGNVTEAQIITKLETGLTFAVTSVVAGVVTSGTAHGLAANQPFKFVTVVGGAGGITAGTTYYAKVITDSTHFTYSATAGGAALTGHSATSATATPVVARMPVFQPQEHTLTLKGMQVSVSQSADSRHANDWSINNSLSYSITPFGGGRSDGVSRESGVSIQSVRIPPTLHDTITLTGTTQTASTTVTVRANIPVISGTGGAPSFDGVFNEPSPVTGIATGSVTPTSLAATTPTGVPRAGLFIVDIRSDLYRFNYSRVYVELVDFSNFA